MTRTHVLELIANGENSSAEFNRDDVRPEDLAKDMSALLNLEGGVILLGVEDNGSISGLTRNRKDAEEWLMNIARNNLQPETIPVWTSMTTQDGRVVGVIKLLADSPGKPHKAKRAKAWVTYMRVGSTSRIATRDEEARLYQAARLIRYDLKAVPGTGANNLDMDRVANYFRNVLNRSIPDQADEESWHQLLINSDLLIGGGDSANASVAAVLLFGKNPNRRLPQSGVSATAFPSTEKDYNMVDEERIRGPLAPIVSDGGNLVEKGVIDRTVDFVERNMGSVAWIEGARRHHKLSYPVEAVREAVVNAVAHRDYALEGTEIEVSLYRDRLEVISPGRLPNGVTVAKMREGVVRVARNELLKEILRDYRYIEYQGMGVRNRIIKQMRLHNGTETDLVEEDDRFVVRFWKEFRQA